MIKDVNDHPALLEARERLLEAILASKRPTTSKTIKATAVIVQPFEDQILKGFDDMVQRAFLDWRKEKAALDEIVRYGNETKNAPPNNYWEPEKKARERLRIAYAFLNTAMEVVGEQRKGNARPVQ